MLAFGKLCSSPEDRETMKGEGSLLRPVMNRMKRLFSSFENFVIAVQKCDTQSDSGVKSSPYRPEKDNREVL